MRTEQQPPHQLKNPNEIVDAFGQMQQQNDFSEIVKELFNENKIYMIGDLSTDEIKLATRIYMIADIKNIAIWKRGLEFYVRFLLSRDRKSRREILDAVKGYQNNNFLRKLGIGGQQP